MKAADVRAALKRYFAAPEYGVVFEVAQATGFSASRHLDAVAMDLWPSRGLALHGIEIKTNLYDWRREKAAPEKAEQIARFCDFFWVAAPKGVIPSAELPMAWGLIEVGDDGKVIASREATKTEAEPLKRPFLAAIMRAATRTVDPDTLDSLAASRVAQIEKDFDKRVREAAERMAGERQQHKTHWEQLLAALGEDPGRFYEDRELIAAIKAVRTAGIAQTWDGLASLREALAAAHAKVAEAMGDLAVQDPVKKRRRA